MEDNRPGSHRTNHGKNYTLKEAQSIGLDQVTVVLGNGIDGPFPGTILNRCSASIQRLVGQANLIISKGGENFDCLEEEKKH